MFLSKWFQFFTLLMLILAPFPAMAKDLGRGLVMYLQVGGDDPLAVGTRARVNGARDAAASFGVTLIEQGSGWNPQLMLKQLQAAIDAKADCVGIMGHPGHKKLAPLVEKARRAGILVTSGNSPLTELQARYQSEGFGYAGVDLYAGGWLTGTQMVRRGKLKPGDRALVLGQFGRAERGLSSNGLRDALEEAGLKVDSLEIAKVFGHDYAQVLPVLKNYLQEHPDLRAIGTQHGHVTGRVAEALKKLGRKPGELVVGGIDLSPKTANWIKSGYLTLVLDQQLYLQGFLPVMQCVMTKRFALSGMVVNTGSGVVGIEEVKALAEQIKAGTR